MSEQLPDAESAPYPRGTLWPPGPWDQEPDQVAFEHAGLRCELRRAPRRGFWRGYALLPTGHRLHGAKLRRLWLDGLRRGMPDGWERGLTWAGPDPERDELGPDAPWFVGFDCSHGRDISPWDALQEIRFLVGPGIPALEALVKRHLERAAADGERAYRDVGYVRRQTELLAEHLDAARHRPSPEQVRVYRSSRRRLRELLAAVEARRLEQLR